MVGVGVPDKSACDFFPGTLSNLREVFFSLALSRVVARLRVYNAIFSPPELYHLVTPILDHDELSKTPKCWHEASDDCQWATGETGY